MTTLSQAVAAFRRAEAAAKALSITPKTLKPPKDVYAPFTSAQVYSFFGSLTNIAEVSTYSFFVLAGDGAPTITAGFVKLNIIDRPQRKGFTVPAGYDPISMTIPIQFEALVAQPVGKFAISGNVEYDIQSLEWMAGRGKRFAAASAQGVGAPAAGDPPLVLISSLDSQGNQTNLIPPNLHSVQWIIASVDYDDHPYRDRSGNRLRQAATVTVTEYVASATTTADSPTVRAKARNALTAQYSTYLSTSALDTLAKITVAKTGLTTENAYNAVIAANKATLGIKSRNQKLKVGTKVRIPTALEVIGPS